MPSRKVQERYQNLTEGGKKATLLGHLIKFF